MNIVMNTRFRLRIIWRKRMLKKESKTILLKIGKNNLKTNLELIFSNVKQKDIGFLKTNETAIFIPICKHLHWWRAGVCQTCQI